MFSAHSAFNRRGPTAGLPLGDDAGVAARAVAFDAMGTLFDLSPLDDVLAAHGAAPGTREAWFQRALHTAAGLTLTGSFRPFAEIAAATLRSTLARQDLDPSFADEVVAALRTMPAFPDAAAAFDVLESAGVPALVLTNGGAEQTAELLERAGLAGRTAAVVTTAEVGAYKPDPRPYRRAARAAGVEPASLALVAAHAWDVHGAESAGLGAVWVDRGERTWPLPVPEARLRASSLDEAARLAVAS